MNKAQLIEKIATETKVSKTQAEAILDCAVENIKKAVKKAMTLNLLASVLSLKQNVKLALVAIHKLVKRSKFQLLGLQNFALVLNSNLWLSNHLTLIY